MVTTHTQNFYNIDNQQDFESVITRLMPTKQDNKGGEYWLTAAVKFIGHITR